MKNTNYDVPREIVNKVLSYNLEEDIKLGGFDKSNVNKTNVRVLLLELLSGLIKHKPKSESGEHKVLDNVFENSSINYNQDELDLVFDNKILYDYLLIKESCLPY